MTSISLNPEKMTRSTIAIFDLMCDGEWYENTTIISLGVPHCIESERDDALKNGHRVRRKSIASGVTIADDILITSGAKDMVRNRLMIAVRGGRMERTKTQHRMTPAACAAWNLKRQDRTTPTEEVAAVIPATPATSHLSLVTAETNPAHAPEPESDAAPASKTTKHRNNEPLIFGGIPEADGWADAPLILRSRVHFRVDNAELSLADFRDALPTGTDVAYDEGTGLYRVDCEHGTGTDVRNFIDQWCESIGLRAKSLRVERDVRRRNLTDLNPHYLSDLCIWFAKYSQGRINKHRSTLQFHFADRDDQDQQVFEWILEAVGRYDDQSGVPFGAFLSERIGKWVHDLNRNKYGRNVSDTELKYQRAMQEFTTRNGRKPTESELAEAMGQDLTQFRKNAQVVSTLQGLRNVGTLDTAPGESEVHLPSGDFCDDRYNAELQQSMLSQILTTSCTIDPSSRGKLATNPNVLGFVAWYDSLWGGKNKTELSSGLGTSMRNMNEYAARVGDRMQTRQSDLVGV
jgi:hypothetical protein